MYSYAIVLSGPQTSGEWLFNKKNAALRAFTRRPLMETDTLVLYQGSFRRLPVSQAVEEIGRKYRIGERHGANED